MSYATFTRQILLARAAVDRQPARPAPAELFASDPLARRAQLVRDMRALLDQHPGDLWGDEQQREYDRCLHEVQRIDAQRAELAQQVLARRRRRLLLDC